MKHFVVTIQRQFGSMGRPIAKRMSEILGVEFYDRSKAATVFGPVFADVLSSERRDKLHAG